VRALTTSRCALSSSSIVPPSVIRAVGPLGPVRSAVARPSRSCRCTPRSVGAR
jgi:hypothetical protein